LEASLVGVPADAASAIRSFGHGAVGDHVANARARMLARERMRIRQGMIDAQVFRDRQPR
jgi:hypothetical protein